MTVSDTAWKPAAPPPAPVPRRRRAITQQSLPASLAQRRLGAPGGRAARRLRVPATGAEPWLQYPQVGHLQRPPDLRGGGQLRECSTTRSSGSPSSTTRCTPIISIAFQVFGALILAAMIEGLRSQRWRGILRAIYFVPSAISLTVAGLLFYFIYEPEMGILNAALTSWAWGTSLSLAGPGKHGHLRHHRHEPMARLRILHASLLRRAPADPVRTVRGSVDRRRWPLPAVLLRFHAARQGDDRTHDDRHGLRRIPGVQRSHGHDHRRPEQFQPGPGHLALPQWLRPQRLRLRRGHRNCDLRHHPRHRPRPAPVSPAQKGPMVTRSASAVSPRLHVDVPALPRRGGRLSPALDGDERLQDQRGTVRQPVRPP